MPEYPSELYQTSAEFEKHVSLDGDAQEALDAALEAAYRLGLAARARITELEAALHELVEYDDRAYYQRVHITKEPVPMQRARAALKGQE